MLFRSRVLEAAFAVHNTLGAGFLEKVYANALTLELRAKGLACEHEAPLQVRYRETIVGDYLADIVVERRVLLELKACSALDPVHEAQIMNYLREQFACRPVDEFWSPKVAIP